MGIDGARVKELRQAKGWSQAKLEEESGVSQSNISRIERGKTIQGLAGTGPALARALGCAASHLGAEDGGEERPDIQTVPAAEAAPVSGAREEFDAVARDLLAETPEEARPAVAAAIEKVRKSGAMQSLDMPLTLGALEGLVKVVSRHTRRRQR